MDFQDVKMRVYTEIFLQIPAVDHLSSRLAAWSEALGML